MEISIHSPKAKKKSARKKKIIPNIKNIEKKYSIHTYGSDRSKEDLENKYRFSRPHIQNSNFKSDIINA